MTDLLTTTNILFVLSLAGVAFTIWGKVKDPQNATDKKQALDKEEVDGKAVLLAQQLNWEKEANASKFKELQENIKESTTMAQNHIHTIDTKVDGVLGMIGALNQEVVKLSTIIEERIPKK